MTKKENDFTVGSPFKKIFLFSVPLALGFALQNLYSLGDALIVSLSRGTEATTGVNVTDSLSFLVLGFGSGIAAGFGVMLSQFIGAKNEQKMKESFITSLFLSVILGIVITVATVILAGPLLKLMKTNELYYDYAFSYISVIFAGFIFTLFYNLASQIMRAFGDSKTPLWILILAATLNLLLDSLLFITDFSVAWAGFATIFSQGVSAVVGFIIIFKKYPVLHFKKSDIKLSASFCFKHLQMGLPMGFQFAITAIGCMIQQSAYNSLPDPRYSMAQSTGSRIDNVFNSLLTGAANALAVYCGQNYGANNIDRVKKGVNSALVIGLIYAAISILPSVFLCKPFARIILKGAEEQVYDWIFQYILTQSAFYYLLFLLIMYRQSLQGLGYSNLTIFGGITELIMRFLAAKILATNFGFDGACFSNPLAWVGGMLFFVISYFVVIKKLERPKATIE